MPCVLVGSQLGQKLRCLNFFLLILSMDVVLVNVNPYTLNIDVNAIREAISSKIECAKVCI
jgi:hypothetical protein